MPAQSLYQTIKRFRTLQTDKISALPIAILMPHSACNCRCVMCDIWKGNKNLKQLHEKDILSLLDTFKKLGTRQVLMSGGEALLNPHFFRFCEILQDAGVSVSLLSTGITLEKHAANIVRRVHDVIVSLDGDEKLHDQIRNIPGAFRHLRTGVEAIRSLDPQYPITSRTVIHRLNFRNWTAIIDEAKMLGLNQVSFLPADVSSQAFNRQIPWSEDRQHEILLKENELPELHSIIEQIITYYEEDFYSGFIAESPQKIRNIHGYYAAFFGLQHFPYKKCNAPWVSTVIEADGSVRPCFFHDPIGNIRDQSLDQILNGDNGLAFRKGLDMEHNDTCIKCVCSLNLSPGTNPVRNR